MKLNPRVEVLAAFIGVWLIESLPGVTKLARWETRYLGWRFHSGFVLAAVAVALIVLSKGDFEEYGLTLRKRNSSIWAGFRGFLVLFVPSLILFFLKIVFPSPLDSFGSVFLALLTLSALLLYLLKKEYSSETPWIVFILISVYLLLPFLAAWDDLRLVVPVFIGVLYQVVFKAFAEELFYRGYVQTRLSEVYPDRVKILSFDMSLGALFSVLLYGLSRVLVGVNLFTGSFVFHVFRGVYAVSLGLFFSVQRERSGDLVASTLTHGLTVSVTETVLSLF